MPFARVAGAWIALLTALTGCKPAVPVAAGPEGLYQLHCAECHAQARDSGGPKMGSSRGPDLSKIGAKRGRTAEYLLAYIRDPKSQVPNAKLMPAFRETLTEDQLRLLAQWLASKK